MLSLLKVAEAQFESSAQLSLPVNQRVSEIQLSNGIVQFNMSIPEIFLEERIAEGGKYIQLMIPGYYNSGIPGEPLLPVFSSLVQSKDQADYTLNLSHLDSTIIDLNEYFPGSLVLPAQASVQKNRSSQLVRFLMKDSIYNADGWMKLPLSIISNEGRMRGMDIGRIHINPIQYHPGENKIKVFYNIQGEFVPESLSEYDHPGKPSNAFDRIMSSIIQEETKTVLKKIIKDEPMTLVVLTDTIFKNALQPFIEWKKQKGFRVVEAYTSNPMVGKDRESIKSYLAGLYTLPPPGYAPPSYLLIVGDIEHVPLSQSGGEITDLFYTTYDGPGDFLPDVIHGRISVQNELELDKVISKILEYEKYLFPEEAFLSNSILIAGSDNSGNAQTYGNGQINYARNYYFNPSHGINSHVYLDPEASGKDQEIRDAIAEGAAFVNYTGHGDVEGWIDPSFHLTHIKSLSNRSKYPLLIGNGCRTNVFSLNNGADCFAEAIIKAENKGALAYIGCTNDSYWKEDFYWSVGIGPETANPEYESSTYGFYDKVFHDGDEPDSSWAPSLGEMIIAGNMTVQQSNSQHKDYYWMIYQLMGDPTLVPWFSIPENPPVIFPESLSVDSTMVNIEALPFDLVAISAGDTLIEAKHADAYGIASLNLPEEFRQDTILLVVTGDRRKPLIRQIPDLGHFELVEITITDESILADGILSSGEQAAFDMTLINTAASPSVACEFVCYSTGNGITVLDSVLSLPSIGSGETIELSGVFDFRVANDIADNIEDYLTFFRHDDRTSNYLIHPVQAHAPVLFLKSYAINDDNFGNGNGMLESGEIVTMSYEIMNMGTYISDSIVIRFASSDTLFTDKHILTGSPVGAGESVTYTTEIVIPDFEEQTDFFLVPINIGDGNYTLDSLGMVVGKYFEDFSTDSLSILPWLRMDWDRDTSTYLTAAASLRSGQIANNQSSAISLKVHVFEDDSITFNFKVSSEPGYDHLRFYMNEEEVGSWSGESDWESYTHRLTNGLHLLKWVYMKDGSRSAGQDAAWIDDIIFPKHAFIPDLYVDSIHISRSGAFLANEPMHIDIANIGLDTIHDFTVRYRNNDVDWIEVSFQDTLFSGSRKTFALPEGIDLSEVKNHLIEVVIRANEDIWPWNDTLSAQVDHYEYPDLSISYINYDTSSRDFINLIALIENQGNIPANEFYYTVVVDDEFSAGGKSTISLNPGESAEASVNLINIYHDWLETGWHSYRLELAEDSVQENNSVEGSIYWIETSLNESSVAGMRFYPNPVSEILYIEANGNLEIPYRLRISDMLGRELLDRNVENNTEQIQLDKFLFSDGMYHISIYNHEGELELQSRFVYIK